MLVLLINQSTRFQRKVVDLCFTRNQLPPHYADILPNQPPPELMQDYLSIEYILNKPQSNPPVSLYVNDTYLRDMDLAL